MTGKPTLVVVSGPPRAGKTTLAHELARAIPCPAICRDEIKEGMAHTEGARFEAGLGDELTMRTFPLFFAVVRTLLEGGVTVVAEAAFQDHRWRPELDPLRELAALVVVRCLVDDATAGARMVGSEPRRAHAGGHAVTPSDFVHLSVDAPTIDVDTSSGYEPPLADIVALVTSV